MSDQAGATPHGMVRTRLSVMMFLQYAIWGAWLPILWPFLAGARGFTGSQIGDLFAIGAVGALLAPFIAGQIADRHFNTEKFLGISHILGAIVVWQLGSIESYWGFLAFSLIYSIIYAPTLPLTNSLAFHHLPDRDRDFGKVRVWGTIGWIVVGIAVGQYLAAKHTLDERGATEQLLRANILDADTRQELADEVQITLSNDGGTFTGTVYDQTPDVIVLNTGSDDDHELEAFRTGDIETNESRLDAFAATVRPERLDNYRQALASLDGGAADAAVLESLLKYSDFTLFQMKGGESEVGHEVRIARTDGTEVRGMLLARTSLTFVIEDLDSKALTVIEIDDMDSDRRAVGQPIIGTRPDGEGGDGDSFTVTNMDDQTVTIDADDLDGQEPYGIFMNNAVQAEIRLTQDQGRAAAFRLSAILGLVLGIFCFMLPKTPPTPGQQKNASAEAMGEIKRNPLLTLFLLAVPISCIHQFYFVHTAGFLSAFDFKTGAIDTIFGVGGGGLMTIGQMTEILVLASIPLVAKKISRKSLLMLGIIAYAVRMLLFSYAIPIAEGTGLPVAIPVILGLTMHGFCFGCFIFVAFMVVDEECTSDVRASAQSLFNLVIVGIGIIVGSKFAGYVQEWATTDGAIDYTKLFNIPMWGALGCLAVLLLFYPRKSPKRGETG